MTCFFRVAALIKRKDPSIFQYISQYTSPGETFNVCTDILKTSGCVIVNCLYPKLGHNVRLWNCSAINLEDQNQQVPYFYENLR